MAGFLPSPKNSMVYHQAHETHHQNSDSHVHRDMYLYNSVYIYTYICRYMHMMAVSFVNHMVGRPVQGPKSQKCSTDLAQFWPVNSNIEDVPSGYD